MMSRLDRAAGDRVSHEETEKVEVVYATYLG